MKTLTKTLLLSLTLVAALGVGVAPAQDAEARPFQPCTCPQVYAPVLGENGVCYTNECYASCAGQDVVGPCGSVIS